MFIQTAQMYATFLRRWIKNISKKTGDFIGAAIMTILFILASGAVAFLLGTISSILIVGGLILSLAMAFLIQVFRGIGGIAPMLFGFYWFGCSLCGYMTSLIKDFGFSLGAANTFGALYIACCAGMFFAAWLREKKF